MQTKKQKKLIKFGEVIHLGQHRLLYGDALNEEHVKKLIGGEKIDSVKNFNL